MEPVKILDVLLAYLSGVAHIELRDVKFLFSACPDSSLDALLARLEGQFLRQLPGRDYCERPESLATRASLILGLVFPTLNGTITIRWRDYRPNHAQCRIQASHLAEKPPIDCTDRHLLIWIFYHFGLHHWALPHPFITYPMDVVDPGFLYPLADAIACLPGLLHRCFIGRHPPSAPVPPHCRRPDHKVVETEVEADDETEDEADDEAEDEVGEETAKKTGDESGEESGEDSGEESGVEIRGQTFEEIMEEFNWVVVE
ncbi:uncharacterized protein E0L32_004956 [Thyridium curvatum]|uniref:Uncharacterized protein n=1 Tax=Thyridium curvatum TaxID=1093900 RepID=A0A507B515_9PEZI|nr:uncharacterized protein E0L32_004956 [Thyridium curvatum]TPX14847.1 hypothetical protein E0L32_004956 [Thyridium curvatum]